MNDLGKLESGKHVVVIDEETLKIVLDYEELGPNARRVLNALADRLVLGRAHGDFDKPHDWDKESSEEALDLAVYQAAKLLGLGKDMSPNGLGGFVFINGRNYSRFHHEGTVTCVDSDGCTPDGKPWVPPVGARVRVAHMWERSEFHKYGEAGDVFTVRAAEPYDEEEATFEFESVPRNGWLLRVVPA